MWLVELYKLYLLNKERKKKEREELVMKSKHIIVHTSTVTVNWVNESGEKTGEAVIYYHFWENGFGNRKITYNVIGENNDLVDPEKNKIYLGTPYPWIHGVDNVNIQSYSQALHGNAMVALKRPAP